MQESPLFMRTGKRGGSFILLKYKWVFMGNILWTLALTTQKYCRHSPPVYKNSNNYPPHTFSHTKQKK